MNKQDITEVAKWVRENCIVIDTETTGLGENDTIVEIAAVCLQGQGTALLMNTLVIPRSYVSKEAEDVHGISEDFALENGRSASVVMQYLFRMMKRSGLYMAAFNVAFDTRLIMQTTAKTPHPQDHENASFITRPADGTTCIMELANRYLHEHLEWDYEQAKFRRLSLALCLEITGIQRVGQAHRALSDALAAAELLNFIAEGKSC